ncbi:FmdB family zinc ribbon protein [Lacisediminihabitans profunda]|uniref:FmdB family transcriptional regulator n=1 Tax=Lacisediminihabitans profunda TaxID=2594790 RepID=A0A5C8UTN1_9MICO|nr:FmdB family zinc ribbon protein [Lacisediminihabitans profunda]TXN30999.1 FmdB family transcriptional regulator [Lacisediminihabitans profunda]
MPTYSYRCASCDHAFDQYQSFTDDSLTVCPHCHEPQLRKVFNSIGVTFNGTGFYRNDARADAKSASKGASGESSGGSATKSDTKSEPKSKPDSAPPAPAKAPAAVSSSAN